MMINITRREYVAIKFARSSLNMDVALFRDRAQKRMILSDVECLGHVLERWLREWMRNGGGDYE